MIELTWLLLHLSDSYRLCLAKKKKCNEKHNKVRICIHPARCLSAPLLQTEHLGTQTLVTGVLEVQPSAVISHANPSPTTLMPQPLKLAMELPPLSFIAPTEAIPALRPPALHPPSLCCGRGLEHSVAESEHAGQMSGLDQLESAGSAALGWSGRARGSGKV